MFFKKLFFSGVILFTTANLLSSLIITEPSFPFRAFIYKALKVPPEEVKNITVIKDEPYYFECSYQGKNYKAILMSIGAIYMYREGQNPLLISFDVREYKQDFRFLKAANYY